jgi:hypothetical protein
MLTKFAAVGRFVVACLGLLLCCLLFVVLWPIRVIVEWWYFGPAQWILRMVRWVCPSTHVLHEIREFQKMIGPRLFKELASGRKKEL